jgi:uncharacterized protein (TIGR02453 family)
MTFKGFPEMALVFYEGLLADNSKAYWSDHRQTYEDCIRAPMQALLAELEPEFGPAKFFRPYRDVRFSGDKRPYKTHAAAVLHRPRCGALYVQLSADGLLVAGGVWHTESDQVERLRRAIADDRTGRGLEKLLRALERAGFGVGGDRIKTTPRGYAADHPRLERLRHKSLTARREDEPAEWLHEPACLDRVVDGFRAVAPLNDWLAANVGPTSKTPARRSG